jgi:hypothetical protein
LRPYEFHALIDQYALCQVRDFDQSQTLVGAIEAETQAIIWQGDDDGCCEWLGLGEVDVDGGKEVFVGSDSREDVLEGGTQG